MLFRLLEVCLTVLRFTILSNAQLYVCWIQLDFGIFFFIKCYTVKCTTVCLLNANAMQSIVLLYKMPLWIVSSVKCHYKNDNMPLSLYFCYFTQLSHWQNVNWSEHPGSFSNPTEHDSALWFYCKSLYLYPVTPSIAENRRNSELSRNMLSTDPEVYGMLSK